MNSWMRRNYAASQWVVYNSNPERFCDYCMDPLEENKCSNEECPRYNHFKDCESFGDACTCSKINKELSEKAGDAAAEASIDERHDK